jgi:hypothetical protein
MYLVTLLTKLLSRFAKQKLELSSSYRCDQIHDRHIHDFGDTLLCYLSQTFMFNKPTSTTNSYGLGALTKQGLLKRLLRFIHKALHPKFNKYS